MDALQRTNERLQDEIQSLRAQLVAASVPAPTFTDETEALRVSVERLGEQVAATEGRLREVVRGRDEDQARYEQLLRDERTRSQQERDECDLLVWRMSREIDTLARDNADLKGRLNRLCDP
jgi:predicted  nucleic acid-binding Zn-ribbon protein